MNQPPPRLPVKDASNTKVLLMVVGSFIGLCGVCGFFSLLANRSPVKTKSSSSLTTAKTTKASGATPKSKSTPETSDSASDSDEKPELEVIESNWEKGARGTVAVWQVTFRNNTDQKIGDIKYEIRYYSDKENQVDRDGELGLTDHLIQKVIEPKTTQTLVINDGLTHREANRALFTLKSWRVLN